MAQQKPLAADLLKPLIVDGIGTLLLVIALYSWFAEPLHPALENQSTLFALGAVGVAMMAWGLGKFFVAMRQRTSGGQTG